MTEEYKNYTFYLPDISCGACIAPIVNELNKFDKQKMNIIQIVDDIPNKTLHVTVDTQNPKLSNEEVVSNIINIIEDFGVSCSRVEVPQPRDALQRYLGITPNLLVWIKSLIGISVGVALLILGILGLMTSPLVIYFLMGGSALLTLLLGADTFYKTTKNLAQGALIPDTLFSISAITSIIVSVVAIFIPWLPMICSAGPMIFGFKFLGDAIRESIRETINSGLTFTSLAPKQVLVDGMLTDVSEITSGTIIELQSGEIIPLDGYCLEEASIDAMDGSGMPIYFKKNQPVLAGMQVGTQSVKICVTKTFAQSNLALMEEAKNKASNTKAPLQKMTNNIMNYFIPGMLVLSILTGLLVSIFFPPALAIQCALFVLVSACPCTLGFIPALTFKTGIAKAATQHVHFKDGNSLEKAAHIDSVVLDLNGTLTTGNPIVAECIRIPGSITAKNDDKDDLLDYFNLIESGSKHAIAKAICHYVNNKKNQSSDASNSTPVPHRLKLDQPITEHAWGREAVINGDTYIVGNENALQTAGIYTSSSKYPTQQTCTHTVYLIKNRQLIGVITLYDPLREEAPHVIRTLKQQGKNVYICTGATKETVTVYREELQKKHDIHFENEAIKTNCLVDREDKNNFILNLKGQGRQVAMVGDGTNDSLPVQGADLGISVKSPISHPITEELAGVNINQDSLKPLLSTFAVAKQTMNNLKQNLLMSLGYNVLSMALLGGLVLAGFAINPGFGAALMVVGGAIGLIQLYRLYLQKIPEAPPQAFSPSDHPSAIISSYDRFKNFFQLTPKKDLHIDADLPLTLFSPRTPTSTPFCQPISGKPNFSTIRPN